MYLHSAVPQETPWGLAAPSEVETIEEDGVYFVSTASHGGYYVTPDAIDAIPGDWREATFNRQGCNGWFEEDCDWAIVALTFPRLFGPQALDSARDIFERWIAPKL
jgi:hypothetical protein